MDDAKSILNQILDTLENINKTQESINDFQTQKVWDSQKYDVTTYNNGVLTREHNKGINDVIQAMKDISASLKKLQDDYQQNIDTIKGKGIIKDDTEIDEILDAIKELKFIQDKQKAYDTKENELNEKINDLNTKIINANIIGDTAEENRLKNELKKSQDELNEIKKVSLPDIIKQYNDQLFKVGVLTNHKYQEKTEISPGVFAKRNDESELLDQLLEQRASLKRDITGHKKAFEELTEAAKKVPKRLLKAKKP